MDKKVEEELLKSLCCPEDASMDEALHGFNKNLASMCNYTDYLKKRLAGADTLGFGKKEKQHIENAIRVAEFDALIWFIICDLSVYIKFDDNAYKIEAPGYEQLCGRRQFIVIMNEGFKHICHFKNEKNKNRERNTSFWVKDIKRIIEEENIPEAAHIYEEITKKLDDFEEEIAYLRPFRDSSIHYFQKGDSPIDLYTMLEDVSKNENLRKHVGDFIFVLRMMRFLLILLNTELMNTLKKHGCIDPAIKLHVDIGLEDPEWLKKMWQITKKMHNTEDKNQHI